MKILRVLVVRNGTERENTMNKTKEFHKRIIAFALMITTLLLSISVYAKEDVEEYNYLEKIFGYASELYIDENITKEDILNSAVKNYLEENPDALVELLKAGFLGLDEYCEYYSGEEYQNYVNNINHTFYGIGVVIQKDGEYVKINSVIEGGSAKEAGLCEGDLISHVNGEDMKDKSIDYVQSKVIGELNTEVEITILREGQALTYTLIRRQVNETTVSSLILDDNTAYVSIVNFALKTASEFSDTLAELDKKGINNIILDLRNNPGGYLLSAVDIAKMIVPEGIIVQTIFRQEENNITYYSDLKNPKYKFAVLVNENTASSAEILTGAIQDSGVGKVFGITTYGKAVIQDMFNMRNGDSFKITTGRYLTRNGREINKSGIVPDVELPNATKPIDVSKYRTIDYSKETSYGDSDENISVIKERLMIMGYMLNNSNNTFDADLEAYVLDFQLSKGLTPTGKLDRITMVQIENAFAQTEVLVDNQLYKAYEYFGGSRVALDKLLEGDNEEK